MSNFANPQNIAVVYPQGINFTGGLTWNVGVWWDNSEFDDVGYLNAVIDSVIKILQSIQIVHMLWDVYRWFYGL